MTGYLTALLQISVEKGVSETTQIAAACQLGKLVESHWEYINENQAKMLLNELVRKGQTQFAAFQYIILP